MDIFNGRHPQFNKLCKVSKNESRFEYQTFSSKLRTCVSIFKLNYSDNPISSNNTFAQNDLRGNK